MQRSLILGALGAGLVAMVGAGPASAMNPNPATTMNPNEVIKAHIPFEFVVDNTTLPAGDYTIRPLGNMDPSALEIQRAGDDHTVTFLTVGATPEEPLKSAEMVFDRVGNEQWLREVLVPSRTGAELAVSSSEKREERTTGRAAEQHALACQS
jgi:hypothetical protein